MTGRIPEELVLAVYATKKGFAFVLLEGPESPFDWGVRGMPGPARNEKVVEAVTSIVDRYQPAVLVIEDTSGKEARRTARIRRLYQSLIHAANANAIESYRYSKVAVQQTFASVGATTKYEIAQAIAMQIPAFSFRLPNVRMPWMSQDARQNLFDAAALGITYYAQHFPSPYIKE